MIFDRLQFINEEFDATDVTPEQYDHLLADAWRHFGSHFFRYNFGIYEDETRRVIPLRIRLADFTMSKSQRRVLRRNAGLEVSIGPANITTEVHELFERHKRRFKTGIPNTIYDFIARDAESSPTELLQITVRDDERLVAISFFDLAERSVSAIYGCFDPEETSRSLGIFTMLKVMEYAGDLDFDLYYHGYAYEGSSFYDYKKRFSAIEAFDWNGNWLPLKYE
ncbi:MAG: GNAT family N-acetyltransferase [Pyrinomonadaceae bacterium]|nr:GNAT family N-acetyltransferase [Acidobacteriota bacterium]MBP7374910.1 GNAT family N-acetyltransferase [Pyrinomonadaceae bacterium]